MSEIAPFSNDEVFVTKTLILIQCISCDRDMSWQPLPASKHSQVVQAACNSHFSSGGSGVRKRTDKQFINFGEFSGANTRSFTRGELKYHVLRASYTEHALHSFKHTKNAKQKHNLPAKETRITHACTIYVNK